MSERVYKADLSYLPLGTTPDPAGEAGMVRDWLKKARAKAKELGATRDEVSNPDGDHWHYRYEAWK